MSKQLSPVQAKITMVVFCLIFVGVGFSMWVPMFLLPTLEWNRMRSWKPAPCTLVTEGDRKRGLEITFRYEWDGEVRNSGNLGTGGVFGTGGKPLWLLPNGTAMTCYVNPRDPAEAVLNRSYDPDTAFGCAPLLFVILPLFALGIILFKKERPPEEAPDALPEPREGSLVIPPSPRGSCGCMLLSFLFFGGLSAGLLLIPGLREQWFLLVFYAAIPGIATLAILRAGFRRLLASFNPRITLTLTPGQLAPGKKAELRWEARGNFARAKSFRFVLEGREDIARRSEVFFTKEIFQSSYKDLRRGMLKFEMPDGVMHSLLHGTRRIVWSIRLHADAPRWPRLGEEYPFEVTP